MDGVLVMGLVVPWLVLLLGCFVGYQLVKQNGRILIRLDRIETDLQKTWKAGAPASVEALQQGLTPGSVAPAFQLPSLTGQMVALEQFRGKDVLLTFFSPSCGFCQQMGPDLAALTRRAAADRPALLVVSTGDRTANQKLMSEYGIEAPVLLQEGMEVASQYQVGGTPMGYLVGADGRIRSEIAVGAKQLLALADATGDGARGHGENHQPRHQGNKPLAESRILRTGLPRGANAPEVRTPAIGGGELSLGAYRGRRVLLVFSAPDCGPCNELAPALQDLHDNRRDLQILMIGRGDAEENRRKAKEYRLDFPIGLQRNWEVSRAFGIFATPAAFLIDEHGVIAEDVATGKDAILALAAASQPQPSLGR